jgi:hypothetical protein
MFMVTREKNDKLQGATSDSQFDAAPPELASFLAATINIRLLRSRWRCEAAQDL